MGLYGALVVHPANATAYNKAIVAMTLTPFCCSAKLTRCRTPWWTRAAPVPDGGLCFAGRLCTEYDDRLSEHD